MSLRIKNYLKRNQNNVKLDCNNLSIEVSLMDGNLKIPSEILELIKRGNKIEAIKMLRGELNIGLKEAKGIVDKISSGSTIDNNFIKTKNISVSEKALDFLRKGKKIDAVKVVREEMGLGLKDSKDIVEKVLLENSEVKELYSAHSREGVRKFFFAVSLLILIYLIIYLLR